MINMKLKWFKNRIGKRIYRDDNDCCGSCKRVTEEGLIVKDENHAEYLFNCQNEMGIIYRDKK